MTNASVEVLHRAFFEAVRNATSRSEIDDALATLETSQKVYWKPVGDDPRNYSSIAINASALSAGLERIINGIDATLEAEVLKNPNLASAKTPRDLVEKVYGVPQGYLKNMKKRDLTNLATKSGLVVRVDRADGPDKCTFEVVDQGIGIHPENFGNTILSIHAGNKMNRWYVVGMYGHGGSATFNFCDYTVIASRARPVGGESIASVGVTVVRYSDGAEDDKMGYFEYLVDESESPLQIPLSMREFPSGTQVRHINYKRATKTTAIEWYEDMAWIAFDPVLPFTLEHVPSGIKRSNFGSRNKLSDSGKVEWHDEYRVSLGPEGSYGQVDIRFWLLKDKNDLKNYCDPMTPVALTFQGQKHATIHRSALSLCKMPFVTRSMVVQVDLDNITNVGRRALLTANREQTQEEGLAEIRDIVIETIREDPTLRNLETSRREESISQGTSKAREELRRNLAEMINRIKPGTYKVPKGGAKKGKGKKRSHAGGGHAAPLQTRDFPTFIKVANKANPIPVQIGRQARIELNSDAPTDFLAKSQSVLTIDMPPCLMEIRRSSDFVGGRLNVWVVFDKEAPVGTVVGLPFILDAQRADGTTARLEAQRQVILVAAQPSQGTSATHMDAPEIVECGENVKDPAGRKFYKDEGWTKKDVSRVDHGETDIIYVNVENQWLLGVMSGLNKSPEYIERVKSRFVLHVAFHAYLQSQACQKLIEAGQEVDWEVMSPEMDRAAHTVATAITTKSTLDLDLEG